MLSLSVCAGGCSKQAEPVMADATVEEPEAPEPEESIESPDPAPSPNVEPTEENIEDTVSSESEDNIENEEDTVNEEEAEPDLGYTINPMEDTTFYALQSCNLRGGPGTNYDKVGSDVVSF